MTKCDALFCCCRVLLLMAFVALAFIWTLVGRREYQYRTASSLVQERHSTLLHQHTAPAHGGSRRSSRHRGGEGSGRGMGAPPVMQCYEATRGRSQKRIPIFSTGTSVESWRSPLVRLLV